jgi:hypothetical protein
MSLLLCRQALLDCRESLRVLIREHCQLLPDAETKGILIINKAMALDQNGDREAAVRLLGELALDPTSTLATEHLANATLASLVRR